MAVKKRQSSLLEKRLVDAKQKLASAQLEMLDAQELAVGMYEENMDLQSQILDLQELIVNQIEGGEA